MLNNSICQIGIIVRDIETSIRAYANVFGIAPTASIVTDTVDKAHTEYRGETTEARARLAFFDFGQVQLELIEPIGGPSTWQEFLDEKGEGVHHVALQVKGMDSVIAQLDSKGAPLVQKGDYTGGRYAYVEATDNLKLILELLENL